ncbi:MAG: SIS domain-containing protein [Anaerolineales bacterium]|nr:SIS domain-containing protein [Anaerolineales bacterium]MDW8160906.1 SIS domain-containing protein [Anaerolineales bacterium]
MSTSIFESEIYEQPDVLSRFLKESLDRVREIAKHLQKHEPKFVLVAARGTSDNAAIYAKYLISAYLRIPVGLAIPSLYTLYHQPPLMRQTLVIGISQSGASPDVLAVMEEARNQKSPTLAILNRLDAPMAKHADLIIPLGCGEERAVAASKTHTAQLLSIASLVALWAESPTMIEELNPVPDYLRFVLSSPDQVRAIAEQIKDHNRILVVGRGFTHCTTHEIALKIKELSYVSADPYSAADFMHGPIALVEEGFPLIAIAPKGKTVNSMKELVNEVDRIGAETIVISNDEELINTHSKAIPLPRDLPEWLAPIVAVVPGQLLALFLTLARGNDPDQPRRLKKVTKTL